MTQIVFIGGLGSNRTQVNLVADILALHYAQKVIGVSFSAAQKNLGSLAALAHDSILITHSAGLLVCEDLTPKEIIAIAPPLPGELSVMTWRTITKTIALVESGRESIERGRKIRNYNSRTILEHILQPRLNVGQAAKICQFNTAQLAVKMINRGVGVTLGFMCNDLLYPHSSRHIHVDTAKRHGAVIHDDIEGHHDEFLLYPLKILEHLNRL